MPHTLNDSLPVEYNFPSSPFPIYPTVANWNKAEFLRSEHLDLLLTRYQQHRPSGITLRVQWPDGIGVCSLCNGRMLELKSQKVQARYIQAIIDEWKMYVDILGEKPSLSVLQIGGRTSSLFTAELHEKLIDGILNTVAFADNVQLGIDGQTSATSEALLKLYRRKRFNSITFDIIDFSPVVQRTINEMQSFAQVRKITQLARRYGFRSLAFRLFYCLPKQSEESVANTLDKLLLLNPDQVYLDGQVQGSLNVLHDKGYDEADFPDEKTKAAFYDNAKVKLLNHGFSELSLGRFSKSNELSFQLEQQNKTTIGLGVGAITDCWDSLAQNSNSIDAYLEWINNKNLPLVNGHLQTEADLSTRKATYS